MNDWADKQAYAPQEEVLSGLAADRPSAHKWTNSAYVPRASRIFEQPPGLSRPAESRLSELKEEPGLGKRFAGVEENLCCSNLVHLGADIIATIVVQKSRKPSASQISAKVPGRPFVPQDCSGGHPQTGQQPKTEVFVRPLPCFTPLKTSLSCIHRRKRSRVGLIQVLCRRLKTRMHPT